MKFWFYSHSVPFIRDGLMSTGKTNKNLINSAKPLENVKILEIGCGAGILTEVCLHNVFEANSIATFIVLLEFI